MRLDKNITDFIILYKNISESTEKIKDEFINEKLINLLTKKSEYELDYLLSKNNENEEYLENFKDFDKNENIFYLILMDLVCYHNRELSTKAINLLYREGSKKEELIENLQKLELLVSNQMIQSYNDLNLDLFDLKNLFSTSLITQEIINEAIVILEIILSDLKSNSNRTQRILRDLKFNEIIVEIFKKDYSGFDYIKLYLLINKLIKKFVKNNKENQKLLFKELKFFISLLSFEYNENNNNNINDNNNNENNNDIKIVINNENTNENKLKNKFDIVPLICSILHDNIEVCSLIDEKLIEQIMKTISEVGHQSRFIILLRKMIIVNKTVITRNQNNITKHIINRKKEVLLLFNNDNGFEERQNLIKQEFDLELKSNKKLDPKRNIFFYSDKLNYYYVKKIKFLIINFYNIMI
jgi:hypothetical protein